MCESNHPPGFSVKTTPRCSVFSSTGFTLVELMVVIAILAVLSAVSIQAYSNFLRKAEASTVVTDIRFLEREIYKHRAMTGYYPENLTKIGLHDMLDPWHRPYIYVRVCDAWGMGGLRKDRFLNPLNTDFDLYSFGHDGRTAARLDEPDALDDVVRANNGEFVGLATDY
ncbi:MAG: prepilin-type N-terminal cleavage/methylation domain-containing protein [Syntrophobacteraceae bacterium]